MLYAFGPRSMLFRKVGATTDEVKQTFEKNFELQRVEQGMDRGEFKSAWYWYKRK
jgi:hypothetical protein